MLSFGLLVYSFGIYIMRNRSFARHNLQENVEIELFPPRKEGGWWLARGKVGHSLFVSIFTSKNGLVEDLAQECIILLYFVKFFLLLVVWFYCAPGQAPRLRTLVILIWLKVQFLKACLALPCLGWHHKLSHWISRFQNFNI